MTANIQYKTTDLDNIFENPIQGAFAANSGFQVAGVDISNRYSALAAASAANGNLGSQIPPTGNLTKAGTDLSSIYVGKPSMWSLTTPLSPTHAGWTTPLTLTHTFTVTFASAAALTNYFTYGGRIIINPTQSTGSVVDYDLQLMFNTVGTFVMYGAGNYYISTPAVPANGIVVNYPAFGGNNIGTTQVLALTAHPASYGSNLYTIKVQANAAAGSATVLTFTCTLTTITHGTIVDTYTGTYRSNISQRNYSGFVTPTPIAAPTFVTTVAP